VKVLSKARRVRLAYATKLGRSVPLSEVAEKAKVDRMSLTRLERGETERFDGEMLAKLCHFYGVEVGDLLEYDPTMQEAGYAAGDLVTA
jgi:DNA-binding Xre family transcriptional regulator